MMTPELYQDDDPLETLRCASANLDNIGSMSPAIAGSPYFQITKAQLDGGILALEKRERAYFNPPRNNDLPHEQDCD